MAPLDEELEGTADLHRAYFDMLLERGFERHEAFALVRDHHAVFAWFAMVEGEQPPGWLGAPTSNASSPSTGGELVSLRPRTPEQ